jgi:hypothetical protein
LKKVSLKYNIFICCVAIACIAGCGVKGNPVRLMDVSGHVQVIRNMKADVAGNSVLLAWDMDTKGLKNNYVAIEKREWGRTGKKCKNCSGNYERIGNVLLNEEKKERNDYNNFVVSDKKVNRGKTYHYRLLLCNEMDVCSERAATEINFK